MTKKDDFIHLHNHCDTGSVLDGYAQLSEYIGRVSELGQPGFGISDHGSVSAVYTLIQKANDVGITPVPGCEFYVSPQNPEGAKAKYPIFYGPNGKKAAEFDVSSNGAYTHQTIWAVNNVGLSNLFKLSTLSNEQEHFYSKPRIDFEMLAEHSDGLVVATGCPSSEVSTRFLMNQDKEAYEYANRLKEIFGERLFVEIMEHNMSNNLERRLLPKQMELSRKLGIKLLATNDAHYTHFRDSVHHEEMLCSQSGSRMSDGTWDEGGSRFAFDGNQYYIKTADEMREVFPEEDFKGAISNTLLIAEMAQDISMSYDPTLKPIAKVPKGFKNEVDYFQHLINQGFEERYKNADREIKAEALRRIKEEFEVIHSSNFIGYFLVVHEYLHWTKENFSLRNETNEIIASAIGAGRGSVGGSIIAFLLNISEVDPIKHDLFFARFLSAGRGDTYEIIYDDGSREEVIVSEKKTLANAEEVKYIHELKVGDEILADGVEETPTIVDEVEKVKKIEEKKTKVKKEIIKTEKLPPYTQYDVSDLSVIAF